jgi:hypothetical protein
MNLHASLCRGVSRLHDVQTPGNDKDFLLSCRRRMLHIAGNDSDSAPAPCSVASRADVSYKLS